LSHRRSRKQQQGARKQPKKKEPPKVTQGRPDLFFALTDLTAFPRQSITTDSVELKTAAFSQENVNTGTFLDRLS
jgi:hypothetical protein